uniref:Uncharacterized protein n=1 Tax=Pseudictyota dubia TaxID=2749911 RepID=A0A7R9VM76_9STRA|mmetsp:Transcript_18099/g.33723  ORF Transcript_18099/g.33723 Transcript_18099/m.33723 type:complete len:104 (+) Transcript_18099:724-1035(+)
MIDTNYFRMSNRELEELRWNRTAKLNPRRGQVAMDDVCEMLNDWVKQMMKANEEEGLSDWSLYVSLLRCCARSVGGTPLTRRELQSSTPPMMIRERRLLYKRR